MKELVCAVPDVTMRTLVEIRLESFSVTKPDRAVYAVGTDKQIAIVSWRLKILYLSSVVDLNAEPLCSSLEYLQQLQSRDSRKTIPVNGNLFVATNNVDVVPRLKLARNLGMRLRIRGPKVGKRLAGKHNAPTKRDRKSVV